MDIDIRDKAQDIVLRTVNEHNDYLKKILYRYLRNEPQKSTTKVKYNQIDAQLTEKIKRIREDILAGNESQNEQQLLVNVLLKEKLKDREDAESNKRHKLIFGIIALILPIVTNAIQYGINEAFKNC